MDAIKRTKSVKYGVGLFTGKVASKTKDNKQIKIVNKLTVKPKSGIGLIANIIFRKIKINANNKDSYIFIPS